MVRQRPLEFGRSAAFAALLALLCAGLAVSLAACDPGAFPIAETRSPPVSEPKGASTTTQVTHGAPFPTPTAADAGAD